MREITETFSIPVDGNSMDFRLTELDAFSGVSQLRMISGLPDTDWLLSYSDGSFTAGSSGSLFVFLFGKVW